MRAVVLGAGLGGVAVAARLARLRHDVIVLDTEATLAGVDATPHPPASFGTSGGTGAPATILWLPAVFRDLFTSTGRPLERELGLVPVDPARRYVLPDGTVLDLPTGSRAATLDAFGRAFGRSAATEWDTFMTAAGTRWQEVRPGLAPADPDEPSTLARLRRRPGHAGGTLRSAAALADPRNRLILDWYAIAAGVDPRALGAGLPVLPYIEHAFGAWQPAGGWPMLQRAVLRRARARGAQIKTEWTTAIRVRPRRPVEIDLSDGTTMQADVVIDARTRRQPDLTDGTDLAAVTIVVACRAVPELLPVETVVLSSRASDAVVVGRPDVIGQPNLITVHAHTSGGLSRSVDEVAAHILARAGNLGVDVDGTVLAVTRSSVRHSRGGRRGTRSSSRTGLIDDPGHATDRTLRVGTPLGGSAALPLLGLSAALVAGMIRPDRSVPSHADRATSSESE